MVSHLRAGTLLCEALAAAGLLECDWAVAVDLKNGDPQFPRLCVKLAPVRPRRQPDHSSFHVEANEHIHPVREESPRAPLP